MLPEFIAVVQNFEKLKLSIVSIINHDVLRIEM